VRIVGSVCTILTLVAITAACQKTSPTAPGAVTDSIAASVAGASAAAATKGTLFTFTKIPAPVSNLIIGPGTDVPIYTFDLTTNKTRSIELSSLSFMISGSLQAGHLSNFRLVFYPGGLAKPGVVVATNDAGWAPGPSFMTLRLSGFTLGQNFKGQFAVLADVSGSSYFFWSQMQTATITINGVEQLLQNPETCDLPLLGDTFHVQ
jgi:hypothetical protein